jgi:murein DD-endopeptidase MepM/ murein hydrolase activator NlpD
MRQPWRAHAGGALIVGLLLAAAAGTPFRVASARDAAPAELVDTDQISSLARLTTGVALARTPGGDRFAFLGHERASRSDTPDGADDAPDADVPAIPADVLGPMTAIDPATPGSGDAEASDGARVWPLRGAITGPYGGRRHHPGLDIDGNTGDPVRASASGVVRIAGRAPSGYSGYGNIVLIDHGNGIATLYAHLSRVAVRPGQSVGTGTYIGAVGTTGHSTGSHLHFEVRRGGATTNPAAWLHSAAR